MSAAADQYEKAAATGHAGALGNRGTRVEKGGEEKRKEGKVVIGWKEEDR